MNLPLPLLAIDPCSRKLGWAFFVTGPYGYAYVNSGVDLLAATAPWDDRVIESGEGLVKLVQRIGSIGYGLPTVLIEVPDDLFSYAKRQIVVYFRSVGAMEYALWSRQIPLLKVSASEDKRKIRKEEGMKRFFRACGRHALTDDQSDAYCIGEDYLLSLMAPPPRPVPPPSPSSPNSTFPTPILFPMFSVKR